MRLSRACAFGVAGLLWQVTAVAAPPPPVPTADPAAAREQLKLGYTLSQAGNCNEAIPHFTESLRLDPRAITLINLADCEEKVGKLADALVHWADARGRAAAEGQKPIEEEATTRAAALDQKVPRLTIVLAKTAPPDAVVERDGVPLGAPSLGVALPLDPGAHTIVVKARGRTDATKQVTLKEGEKQTIDVDAGAAGATAPPPVTPPPPPPEPEKSGMSPLVPIGFGVGIVGLAVGTITGIITLGKGSDADTACPDKKCPDEAARTNARDIADSGKTVGTISTIAFIAGGVGAGVGIVGLLMGGKKTESKVDVGIGPSSFMLRGRF